MDSGKLCQACKRKNYRDKDFFVDALIVSSKYKENNLSKIIHSYKYNLVQDLHVPLGKILTKAFLDSDLSLPDLIIPAPLHRRRLRWRGFNQSELLADYISKNLAPGMEIPVQNDILVRNRHLVPQMKIKKYSERKENIKNAFSLASKNASSKIKGKKILLIDDIATTGATLNECARILKENGARKVFATVLARQEWR